MASVGSDDGDIGFQIAPMVDVVFVLMLFFMASAGQKVVERELGINLPGGQSAAQGAPPIPIMVDIASEGQVTVNNVVCDSPISKELPTLRAQLKKMVEAGGGKDPVIIRPANDARHERIIDVLNAAGASGVKNLSFN